MMISKAQAKAFILRKQGLLGHYRFNDKQGCLDFISQAGCIQFDPIDRCGKNTDLVLFSRVKNYQKSMLEDLLYKDYQVVDQWDKNMSIYGIEDWPYLEINRIQMSDHYVEHLVDFQKEIDHVRSSFNHMEYIDPKDLLMEIPTRLHAWHNLKLSQAILDYLYFKGEIMIHHRKGLKRFFGLTETYIDKSILNQKNYFTSIEAYQRFMIKRRISAVGMLGSGASDAFLGIQHMKAKDRRDRFQELLENEEIIELVVENNDVYYILKEDKKYLKEVENEEKRIEFIAPLDSFIWDRKLIKKLFDFDYKWEIYTPEKDRKYGPYVLPILYGHDLVGRIDVETNHKLKTLYVHQIWLEEALIDKNFNQKLKNRIKEFSIFNACDHIEYKI